MRVFRSFLIDAIGASVTFFAIAAILGYLLDLLSPEEHSFNLELLILAVVTGLFLPLWSRLWRALGSRRQ